MKVTGGRGKNGRTNIQRNNDKTQVWLKKKELHIQEYLPTPSRIKEKKYTYR